MAAGSGWRIEKWAWIGMRLGGLFLVLLLAAHVLIQYIPAGAQPLPGFGELQARWAHPGWRALDGVLLVLVGAHAGNGLRQVVRGRKHGRRAGYWLFAALAVAWLVVMALGIAAIARGGLFILR
jgi:succinate dehydrogenase / fumarate reductase, membrane anchor subunit